MELRPTPERTFTTPTKRPHGRTRPGERRDPYRVISRGIWLAVIRLIHAGSYGSRLKAGTTPRVWRASLGHGCAFSRRHRARAVLSCSPSSIRRAQGRPGAGRARGPPAQKNAGGRYHRFSRDHPALPARWSSRLYAGFLALGLLAAMRDNAFHALRGDTSVEVSEPCNFTSARASFVRTSKRTCCEFSRPPLPASRVVTIARNAPPQVRRDAREDRGDLPDDTSEITCDIVTRRAGNAPPSLVISRRRQPISRFRVQGERPSPRNDGGLDIAELMSSAAHAAALASSTPWNA